MQVRELLGLIGDKIKASSVGKNQQDSYATHKSRLLFWECMNLSSSYSRCPKPETWWELCAAPTPKHGYVRCICRARSEKPRAAPKSLYIPYRIMSSSKAACFNSPFRTPRHLATFRSETHSNADPYFFHICKVRLAKFNLIITFSDPQEVSLINFYVRGSEQHTLFRHPQGRMW